VPVVVLRCAMAIYRAYVLGEDGHFMRVHEIDAERDDAAIQAVCGLNEHSIFELWCGARQIGRVTCAGEETLVETASSS
jgi:hypothetical protein